ncbi:MAG: hypothetical protein O2788_03195 [Chloroflexi bacterium]|nr:hypothetical protein [Chloroflexota bacterium]
MLKGVLVAFGIILASIPVPIVHFITVPVGPFVAGFVGGGVARANEGRVVIFGLIVGTLALIPAAVLLIVTLALNVDLGLPTGLVVAAAIALVPYTWFGVTVGALISFLLREKERKAAEKAGASQP